MIAGFVFAVSFFTVAQFFASYCHSPIAEARCHELSEQAREISRAAAHTARADQFKRLLELITLCPGSGGDTNRVRAVSTYFNLLGLGKSLLGRAIPAAAHWIETERDGCTYVAAVALDRRIAYSRSVMSQLQASDRL